MHSCLGIMDGAAQLLPGPAAGDGSEGGMNGDVASVHVGDRWSEGWADGRTYGNRIFCVHFSDSSARLYLHLSLMLCGIYRCFFFFFSSQLYSSEMP